MTNANLATKISDASTNGSFELTFFSKPRVRTGSIFKFSEIASCALAPAPPEVMLVLYAMRMSIKLF